MPAALEQLLRGDTQALALRVLGVGSGHRACCFPKSSGLCGSQEEVLGLSQRAWLPGAEKETSSVPRVEELGLRLRNNVGD